MSFNWYRNHLEPIPLFFFHQRTSTGTDTDKFNRLQSLNLPTYVFLFYNIIYLHRRFYFPILRLRLIFPGPICIYDNRLFNTTAYGLYLCHTLP